MRVAQHKQNLYRRSVPVSAIFRSAAAHLRPYSFFPKIKQRGRSFERAHACDAIRAGVDYIERHCINKKMALPHSLGYDMVQLSHRMAGKYYGRSWFRTVTEDAQLQRFMWLCFMAEATKGQRIKLVLKTSLTPVEKPAESLRHAA